MARIISDIDSYLVGPDTALRDVMARINQAVPPMLIVASDQRQFLGTITDGDIRRALLRGGGNENCARDIMQSQSITGLIAESQDNRRKLDALATTIRFLPVLNADGTVAHLLLEDGPGLRSITALVMAGGFGRRLGHLTLKTPKPLLPVQGRPILDHVLESLENAGIRRIFVSTHYLAEQVENFIAKRDSIANIGIVHEPTPLGTGGAIGLLPSEYRTDGDLIVLNGDVISNVSFDGLVAFNRSHEHNATVCVKEHRTRIDFGVIRFSDESEFERIDEKPELSHFIAAGIYLLDPSVTGLIRPGDRIDMPDVFNRAHEIGLKVGVFPVHENWVDVGRPKDLAFADSKKAIDPQ
jgi:dTDP-glucose pyrophosphorylase